MVSSLCCDQGNDNIDNIEDEVGVTHATEKESATENAKLLRHVFNLRSELEAAEARIAAQAAEITQLRQVGQASTEPQRNSEAETEQTGRVEMEKVTAYGEDENHEKVTTVDEVAKVAEAADTIGEKGEPPREPTAKASEEPSVPHEVQSMLNATATAQGRCGLIAGFTYYELSRQGRADVDRIPAYAFALLCAFSLATVSAALATFIRVHMRSLHHSRWLEYKRKMSLITAICYIFYIVASISWVFSMSLMGEVYNSHDEYKNAAGGSTLALHLSYVPLYAFGPCLALCFLYIVVLGGLYVIASKNVEESSAVNVVSAELQYTFVDKTEQAMKTASSSGDSTMYLLGFTGAGLARYHQFTAHEGEDYEKWLNMIYWVAMNLAGACLAFVNVCGTHFMVVLKSLPAGPRRTWLCTKLSMLGGSAKFAVLEKVAINAIMVAGLTIGWGCSGSCKKEYLNYEQKTIDGVCFVRVAFLPAGICAVAFISVKAAIFHLHRCSKQATNEHKKMQAEGPGGSSVQVKALEEVHQDNGELNPVIMQKTMDLFSSQASLFSGFVFYNVCCFDTDILQAPITSSYVLGITGWNQTFIAFTVAAFSFGMATVNCGSEFRHLMQRAGTLVEQSLFARHAQVAIRMASFQRFLAMSGFIVSFALLGLVKLKPMRPEPFVATIVSLFLYALLERWMRQSYRAAANFEGSLDDLGVWVDAFGSEWRTTYPRIQTQIAHGTQALFFGSFAYNAINFFFRPEALMGPSYAVMMSICFMISLCIVLSENNMQLRYHSLQTEAKKEKFGRSTTQFVRDLYMFVQRLLQAFLVGITLMGFVKLWQWVETATPICNFNTAVETHTGEGGCQLIATEALADQEYYSRTYGLMISGGGLVAFVLTFECRRYVLNLAVNISRKFAELTRSINTTRKTLLRQSSIEVALKAIPFADFKEDVSLRMTAATFQAGNVFYEVLFTTVNPDKVGHNIIYLGFSVITLVLGCCSVAIGIEILFWFDDFPTSIAKSHFVNEVQPAAALLYYLYVGSLLSWLLAMLSSSQVKYGEDQAWFSFITCGPGLLIVLVSWCFVKFVCSGGALRHPAEPEFEDAADSN
eukprot:TRINITY_DN37348_c0_g1_i1.p1 TRINITY_DN37348_c0_g1~~TRINITY_DN37348_c0_g1_i1.p1  ORF type:complete len:1092 (-),score=161.22 TRINITY_DN37348_c0_g1_i1:159-3434(-)